MKSRGEILTGGEQPQQHLAGGRMLFEQRQERGARADRGDERGQIHQRQIGIGLRGRSPPAAAVRDWPAVPCAAGSPVRAPDRAPAAADGRRFRRDAQIQARCRWGAARAGSSADRPRLRGRLRTRSLVAVFRRGQHFMEHARRPGRDAAPGPSAAAPTDRGSLPRPIRAASWRIPSSVAGRLWVCSPETICSLCSTSRRNR